jgi:peptidoglycan/xylan/chitin deacetylase (PgdA/CDA1 family)
MIKKIGYLTIDDAPSKIFVEVVDYLIEMKIPAIFFCEGRKLIKRVDDAIYAINKGYIIGNHSYDHPNFSQISLDEARNQIEKTDEIIDYIYAQTGIPRPIKVFRFPFLNNGSKDENQETDWDNEHVKAIQKILKKLGYRQPKFENINFELFKEGGFDKCLNVDCTYDTFDWCLEEGEEMFGYHDLPTVLARIDEDVPEGGRGLNSSISNEIIEMHNWIPFESFKAIIEKILTKNIEFKMHDFT